MSGPTAAERGEQVLQAGEPRLARVESVRALAALGVVVGHLWVTSHGFAAEPILGTLPRRLVFGLTYGVWVFFGLTGYLLFWPFVRRHFAGERLDLRRYARNRVLRILPLYWFAVVLLLAVHVEHPTTQLLWRHLLLLQNFWRGSIDRVDAPLWSVVVEMQFYALLPLLAFAVLRFGGRSRLRAAGLLAVLAAASMAARQVLALDAADPALTLSRFQLPTTFGFFAAGMSVALLRSGWEERPPAWLRGPLAAPWLWLAGALPLWALMCWRFDLENVSVLAVFLVVGSFMLPLRAWRGVAALDWRPLALLGVVSYSLYVWHAPLILELHGARGLMGEGGFALVLAAIVPLCIATAAVSYVVVERPPLRLRRRWAPATPPHAPLRSAP